MLITTMVRIVKSPIFRFIVGKNKKPMTIHTALVAAQSPALRTLVSGAMNEAYTKTVIWDDVDRETFALFAEFAYTGDYSLPASYNKNVDPTSCCPHPNPRISLIFKALNTPTGLKCQKSHSMNPPDHQTPSD